METCQKACIHYAKLHHDEKLDKKLKGKTGEEALSIRTKHANLWTEIIERKEDRGRDNCELMCRTSSRISDVSCMVEAKTANEARVCLGQQE